VSPAFRPYAASDAAACLGLFDANCPRFFAPGERADYADYLARARDYRVGEVDGAVRAAFGIAPGRAGRIHLNWILVDPDAQGAGLGRAMMAATLEAARMAGASTIDIAASQHSAPFFARFGARALARTENGWGPGMHRVEMELDVSPAD
jgi:GNAT superfamily N-acetyltransferase